MNASFARLVAALVLAAGCGGCDRDSAGPTALERATASAESLGDAELAGQRTIAGFEGESPPAKLRRLIRAGRLAGVILFDDNFDSAAEARELAAELQAIERPRGLRDPLLIMVDQEGGAVKRLPGPPTLSAAEMGAAGASSCGREGRRTGRYLHRSGINVDLAPVLDVGRPGSAIEAEGRSFGGDPGLVARCGEAFAGALRGAGVAPTAKHFPGLGAADVNTDDAVQRINLSKGRIRHFDARAYEPYLADGAEDRLVMLSSAIYPGFAPKPAAFSGELATVELRRRLGFEGVSITDSLETASSAAFGGPVRSGRRAARAGVDLLLFTSVEAAASASRPLRDLLRADRGAFVESVARVLALRAGLG